jgi:hypothetical protein
LLPECRTANTWPCNRDSQIQQQAAFDANMQATQNNYQLQQLNNNISQLNNLYDEASICFASYPTQHASGIESIQFSKVMYARIQLLPSPTGWLCAL